MEYINEYEIVQLKKNSYSSVNARSPMEAIRKKYEDFDIEIKKLSDANKATHRVTLVNGKQKKTSYYKVKTLKVKDELYSKEIFNHQVLGLSGSITGTNTLFALDSRADNLNVGDVIYDNRRIKYKIVKITRGSNHTALIELSRCIRGNKFYILKKEQ